MNHQIEQSSGPVLRSLLAKMPVCFWTTDQDLRVNSFWGVPLLSTENLVSAPESLRAHRTALGGQPTSFVAHIEGRLLEAYVEPLGAERGVAGIAIDSTARLVAERALRLSEQSYRSLIDEAPYAICRTTESGQILQTNPAMLAMLGYQPGEMDDLLLRDLPVLFTEPDAFMQLSETLLSGATVQGFEAVWSRRDGRAIEVRIGGRAIRGCLDLFVEDVTEKKELTRHLRQAQKMQMLGQLAGGVAHDFNNLLTVINGYCDLLLLATDSEEERRRQLTMMRQAGERASGLTQQLLAFSRQQVTVTQPVSLNSVVAEAVELSRRLIGEHITVVERLAREAGNILADSARVHQMLMNLIVNARDAMPDGGRLDVGTRVERVDAERARALEMAPGECAVISISDTGVGMDDHVRAHLFEPFFTTKALGKGTGLGLATVYGLVRQLAGGITVESSPGRGAHFNIYLHRIEAEIALDDGPSPQPFAPGTSTILVVEDDASVRRYTAKVLAGAGYSLLEASDAAQALEIAHSHNGTIDLLLTDMVMPGAPGTELAATLRPLHPGIRVLLVSGYSELLVQDQLPDKSFHYLQKPFSPEQLTRTVNGLLQ
jgi:PAS domain S-box-containing protein